MSALVRIARTADEMERERLWLSTVPVQMAPWYRKPFAFVVWYVRWLVGKC